MNEADSDAFKDAVEKLYPTLYERTNIAIHNCSLKHLPQELRFDAVVSPANSYGRLDGAFDDALARVYGPRNDYGWITRKAQKVLYEQWKGFAPPGTCTVVSLDHPAVDPQSSRRVDSHEHPWGTKYLLLCPTMRIPQNVTWDNEVVYECIWSMLCAVDRHNLDITRLHDSMDSISYRPEIISTILMTPLATGVGRVSPRRWAEQCVLAMKHWSEATENPETWSSLEWHKILDDHDEVVQTY